MGPPLQSVPRIQATPPSAAREENTERGEAPPPWAGAEAWSRLVDFLRRRSGWWLWLAVAVAAWTPPRNVDGSPATTGAMAVGIARVDGWHFGPETGTADGPLADFLAPVLWPENLRSGWLISVLAAAFAGGALLCVAAATPRPHRWLVGASGILLALLLPAPWLLLAAVGGMITAALTAPAGRNADSDLWVAPALACGAMVHAFALPVAVVVQLAVGLRHWRAGWRRFGQRSVIFVLAFGGLWEACQQPVGGLAAYATAGSRAARPAVTAVIFAAAESRTARWHRLLSLVSGHPTRAAATAWTAFTTGARRERIIRELSDSPVQTPLPDVAFVRGAGLTAVPRGAPAFVWRLAATESPAQALDPARRPPGVPPDFRPAFVEDGVAVWRHATQPPEWTPAGQVPATIPVSLLRRYGGFGRLPVAAAAAGAIGAGTVGGEPLLQFPVPGELRFRIHNSDATVRGCFALADPAGPGAEFAVVFASGAGERELFRRILEPARTATDRGRQLFTVDLPGLGDGFLVFRTVPRPGGGGAAPTAGWGGVTFGTLARQGFESNLTVAELRSWGHFNTLPARITAFARAGASTISGRAALGVHVPSEMVFPVLDGATSLTGIFGFNDGAWSNPRAHTPGAVFRVLWRSGDRERTLLERTLDPAQQPDDRGPQAFRIDLQGLAGGLLLLCTEPGPDGSNAFGWTAWGELTIEGQKDELVPSYFNPDELARLAHFRSAPTRLAAWSAPAGTLLDGQPALFTHAPSEMVFPVTGGLRELRAAFGLAEGAYLGEGHSDGAVFRVLWQSGGPPRELYSRRLDPVAQPADRGRQTLAVPLTGLRDGLLILRTETGPAGNGAWDWTCWADVELRPEP